MRILVALLVFTAFAGCSDSGDAAPEPVAIEDLAVDSVQDGLGVIRGVVVDAAITPVGGVLVTDASGVLNTTTNENGAFLFKDIEPGTYFLNFDKLGYASVQQSTEVVAGVAEPQPLKVLVERIPGTEPYVDAQHFRGFIGCSFKLANYVFDQSWCDPAGTSTDESYVYLPVSGAPDFYQTETVWDSTQALGDGLVTIQWACAEDETCSSASGGEHRTCNTRGVSPLLCWGRVGEAGAGGGASLENSTLGLEGRGLHVQMFAHCAVCAPDPYGSVGVGVALNQEYDTVAHFFFNYAPPEGWSFGRDGAYEP